jgi:hypothetical protein
MNAPAHLSSSDQANLLAGHALAYATAYLDGRNDATELARNTRSVQIACDAPAKPLLDAARMLVVAMTAAAWAAPEQASDSGEPSRTAQMIAAETRLDRWQHVMGALVELVRHEAIALAAHRAGNVECATGASPCSSPARETSEGFVTQADVREWQS